MTTRLLLAALLIASGCAHPADNDPPAPAGLAERFELIAFYNEFARDEQPLHRWGDGRILLGVYGAAGDRYRADVADLAEELRGLTGNYVYPVRSGQPVEIIVLIDTPGAMRQALDDAVPDLQSLSRDMVRGTCGALFYPATLEDPYRIGGAIVTIDSRLGEDHIRRCIVQEITQALGLPNDIDDPDGTVFSSGSTRTTLSESDRNIVRILYDPRLEPGMTRAEAMPIVRQIAAELEAQQAEAQ